MSVFELATQFFLSENPRVPKDIMYIVFLYTIGMRRIRTHGMNGQVSLDVVNHKWGIVDISCSWGRRSLEIACGAWLRCRCGTVLSVL